MLAPEKFGLVNTCISLGDLGYPIDALWDGGEDGKVSMSLDCAVDIQEQPSHDVVWRCHP